uniref:NADH-ubiquinone oxidoreductase chain 2 n=1 Tax=Falconius longicornis TaxID=2793211 RepID=A0A7U3QCL1_9ORTH|nr:NADH dehydrogenase subunit 2 [Falconius longicornis]
MKKMPIKMLFSTILITSTIISITSHSWLGMWMGLEINLLAFIPLISQDKPNPFYLSSIKYFIIQAIASITLIMTFITTLTKMFNHNEMLLMTMSMSFLLKIGAAPLHFWLPEVMENLSWDNCIIIMTWQKIAPMSALQYLQTNQSIMMTFILTSAITGAIMGLNQMSLRKLMAYSSINHIAWMLAAMQSNLVIWMQYILLYSTLTIIISLMFKSHNIFMMNELFMSNKNLMMSKLTLMMSVLSMGGLPPLLGFLPKWLVIQELLVNSLFITMVTLIMSSTITLYFYMKMFMSSGMYSFMESKWNTNKIYLTKMEMITLFMNSLSLLGLTISPVFM